MVRCRNFRLNLPILFEGIFWTRSALVYFSLAPPPYRIRMNISTNRFHQSGKLALATSYEESESTFSILVPTSSIPVSRLSSHTYYWISEVSQVTENNSFDPSKVCRRTEWKVQCSSCLRFLTAISGEISIKEFDCCVKRKFKFTWLWHLIITNLMRKFYFMCLRDH